MLYADARDKIKSGDILAWSHRGWRSWYDIQIQAVRIFTRSEYCHVGMAWVTSGRVFVLEAVSPLVRNFPLSKLTPFFWLPQDKWSPEIEKTALSIVGKKYSKLDAILAYFGDLKPGERDTWECAEYVAYVLDIHPEKYTPSSLIEEVQKNDNAVIYYVE